VAELPLVTKAPVLQKHESWNKIRASEDYRSFLKTYLSEFSLSYSDFARVAGVTRGFPSDVIQGKRRLTSQSCFHFEKALKLPAAGRQLFRMLVAKEEPDEFPEFRPVRVLQAIDELRTKTWLEPRRTLHDREAPQARTVFQDRKAALVYASSGEPGKGATFDEMLKRTRLKEAELREVIDRLVAAGILRREEDRLISQELHLFVPAADRNAMFTKIFQNACQAASESVVRAVDSEQDMFFTSAFCVKESQLPMLKAALRETVLRFVDNSIAPDGDRIVHLISALHT
jgi:transcriptional regulator with XRE-family HTH domain